MASPAIPVVGNCNPAAKVVTALPVTGIVRMDCGGTAQYRLSAFMTSTQGSTLMGTWEDNVTTVPPSTETSRAAVGEQCEADPQALWAGRATMVQGCPKAVAPFGTLGGLVCSGC